MLKDILVHVDASAAAERRVRAAALLAERSEGHVFGLHVVSAQDYLPWSDGFAMDSEVRQARERAAAELAGAEAAFRRAVAGHAVSSEWRALDGVVDRCVALHARYADLVVLGQIDPRNPPLGSAGSVPQTVPLTAGRPALIIPCAAEFATLGESVLVGWDGGREAARAVHDALPLLKQAKRVVSVSVGKRSGVAGKGERPAADLALHLARHGIKAEALNEVATDKRIGDVLLSLATDLSVDLIVMGAYGHSRVRELVLGGVTRVILERMTVPVLMSH